MTRHHAELLRHFPDSVEIIGIGLVDTADAAYEAGKRLRAADVDLVFCQLR